MEENQEIKFSDVVKFDDGNHIINGSQTVALVRKLQRDPNGLNSLELLDGYNEKKRDLEKKAHELAIILRERHGYTVDDELLASTIWHLRQAGFMDNGTITAYYFNSENPVIVGCDGCYAVVAPKLLG